MFSKPTAKPASSPAGQLLGLAVIAAAMFIATNPSSPLSLKVHKTLSGATSAVSSSLSSNSPVFSSSGTEPEAYKVSYQSYAAADGRVASIIIVSDVSDAYPDLQGVSK